MPIKDIIKPEMLYYGEEIGIVKNRDDVDVDVDAVIKRLTDKYELNIIYSLVRQPQLKSTMLNFTRDEEFWYTLFVGVSRNAMRDSHNNWLGDNEDIRDRLVIENLELMLNSIYDIHEKGEPKALLECMLSEDNPILLSEDNPIFPINALYTQEPIFPINALYVNK